MTHITDEWNNCYPSQWKGLIVQQAMTHPAKFSSKLIRRIYEHMQGEGWLRIGDRVIDPFGGVALGALEAMLHGLHWTGVELEAKFAEIGNENIALWNVKFGRLPRWGEAVLLNGDSRRLLELVRDGRGVVSSPPYVSGGHHPDQTGAYNTNGMGQGQTKDTAGYGKEDGQLGRMQPGDFHAAITSPPFRHSEGGTPEPKPGGSIDKALYARHAAGNSAAEGYGNTDGNLANLEEGDFQATVSSPPYIDTDVNYRKNGLLEDGKKKYDRPYMEGQEDSYGKTEGQLSSMPAGEIVSEDSGETFWSAARLIVEQVYLALEPGGHAAWVVKDYVKNKERVPFSDQWRQLCESVGFVTLHEHHAMLVHHKGSQHTLDGDLHEIKTESKSFFRRLAEKKGSPRIDFETVYCMVKP